MVCVYSREIGEGESKRDLVSVVLFLLLVSKYKFVGDDICIRFVVVIRYSHRIRKHWEHHLRVWVSRKGIVLLHKGKGHHQKQRTA